jgi:hypothetical protein
MSRVAAFSSAFAFSAFAVASSSANATIADSVLTTVAVTDAPLTDVTLSDAVLTTVTVSDAILNP